MMGSPESLQKHTGWMADSETQHRVRLTRPFYIGAHEVSLAAFRAFVDETNYETDAEKGSEGDVAMNPKTRKFEKNLGFTWKNPGFEQSDKHPVVCVSWHDARAFCRWLSRKEGATYRLPTEAEWEYACRAGTTTRFCAGEAFSSLQANGDGTKAYNGAKPGPNRLGTVPLETFEANAFGLYEMHGNVWEWCSDWYAPYDKGPAVDPIGAKSGELRPSCAVVVGTTACTTFVRPCGCASLPRVAATTSDSVSCGRSVPRARVAGTLAAEFDQSRRQSRVA